ncbi:MAG: (2Fe-2S)-binding protein [Acidobacteriota bacterium]
MTACACTGIRFGEVLLRLLEESESLDAVLDRTGCGRMCTACVPDLEEYVHAAPDRDVRANVPQREVNR